MVSYVTRFNGRNSALSNQSKEPVLKSRIWTNRDDKLALYLGVADAASVDQYIRSTSGVPAAANDASGAGIVPQQRLAWHILMAFQRVLLLQKIERSLRTSSILTMPWTERMIH
ncbi:hypothetical protein [Marinomonas fungiae]|uniref:hypothetical protein n=1 Tax=Marinomonas fungiae TaxID=1137284 RepID=UPI003A91F38B